MIKKLLILALLLLNHNLFGQSVGDQRTSYWNGSIWTTGTFTGTGNQLLIKGTGSPQTAVIGPTLSLSGGSLGVNSSDFISGIITGTNNTFIFEGDSITVGGAVGVGQSISDVLNTPAFPDFYQKGVFRNVAIGGTGFLATFNAGSFTGTLTNGGTNVAIASSSAVKFGYSVVGTGIPANTFVLSVPTGTSFTISNPATITGTSSLTMSGTTIGARYQYLVYPHRPTANGGDGGTMSILSVEAGANDCQVASSGTAYIAVRNAYMAQAVADGFTVVDHTIMPHDGYTAANELVRQIANSGTSTTLGISTGTYSTATVDLASIFPNNRNTAYFNVDGIHLTAAANLNWASAIQESLRTRTKYPFGRVPTSFYLPYYQLTSVAAINYKMNAQGEETTIGYSTTSGTGQRVELAVSNRELAGRQFVIADFSGSASPSNPINIARFGYGIGGTDLVNGADIIPAITTPYGVAIAVGDGLTKWSVSYSSRLSFTGTVVLTSGAGSVVDSRITTSTIIPSPTLRVVNGTAVAPLVTVFSGSATFTGAATDSGTYNWVAFGP